MRSEPLVELEQDTNIISTTRFSDEVFCSWTMLPVPSVSRKSISERKSFHDSSVEWEDSVERRSRESTSRTVQNAVTFTHVDRETVRLRDAHGE